MKVKQQLRELITKKIVFVTSEGNILTENYRCKEQIKASIAMANRRKILFCSNTNLEMRKTLMKCHVLSVLSYGCKTKTMGRRDRDRVKVFEI